MNPFCSAGEYRAAFARILTKREDVIEMLSGELVEVLRTVTADINPDLVHDLNGLWANNTRPAAGAFHFEVVTRFMS